MEYIVGIDPGSTKGHGVAIYINGALSELHMMQLMELHDLLASIKRKGSVVLHIEDVWSSKGVWHGTGQNKNAFAGTAANVSLCKWAQIEVERMCKHIGLNFVRHRISRRWKSQSQKKEFERVTGWQGRSNEDTRSAAYFGFLAINKPH